MSDTIAAIATAAVPSAIGIVRLSGEDAIACLDAVFTARSGRPMRACSDRHLMLGTVRDRRGRVIDEALATVSRAPNSYTGEDTAELQCHGSPAVLAAALDALFAAGARQARPGEFTRRAFLNGRMDLVQAEAVADLIDAETAEQATNAAGQLAGAIQTRLAPVYTALTDILAHFHAALDYPDEDIDPFHLAEYDKTLSDAAGTLAALLATADRGRVLRKGVRTVILGRPNAGKSSLLNALAGYRRVIVSDTPGTTRDTVEERVQLGRVLLRLTDTAGIRESGDALEQAGVALAKQAAASADLALFVCDGSQPLTQADYDAMEAAKTAAAVIALRNKADLPQTGEPLPFETVLPISAKTGAGLDALTAAVEARFASGAPCDGSILTNTRQAGAIERARASIVRARETMQLGFPPDAVLSDVEQAMEALAELTGRTVREDVVSRIFERFCVGK